MYLTTVKDTSKTTAKLTTGQGKMNRTPPRETRGSAGGRNEKAGSKESLGKVWAQKEMEKAEEAMEVCLNCKKKVSSGQKAVQCDACNGWFHAGCAGVGGEEYEKLKGEEEIWLCRRCRECARDAIKENAILKQEVGRLTRRLEGLEEMVRKMRREVVDEVVERVQVVKPTQHEEILGEIGRQVEAKVEEALDKKRRKTNLVIFKVKESNRARVEEKIEDDRRECREIFSIGLGVEEIRIEKVIRLGKIREDGRGRPILVKVGSETEKWNVVGQAKKLRNVGQYRSVYINPDQTKDERERDKRLRDELTERRNRGEAGWMIRRGELTRDMGARPKGGV